MKFFYVSDASDRGDRYWLCSVQGKIQWLAKNEWESKGLPAPTAWGEEHQAALRERYGEQIHFQPVEPPTESTQTQKSPSTPQPEIVAQSQEQPMPQAKTNPDKPQTTQSAGRSLAGKETDMLTKPWQKSISPWINVLYVLLCLGVFFVCLWNIAPYEVAVRYVASKFENSGLVWLLLNLPVIGWILQFLGRAIFWIIGAIVWACIQIIELMPLVMTSNPGYVRSVLVQQEAHEKLKPRDDDPGVIRYLKKFYNHLPLRFLTIARRLRGWVYVLDMLIVAVVYPPVREGGIARFFFLLATGQWGQFDWANIVLMFVTLLAVEAVVKLLLVVYHFRSYLKSAKSQPANATA